MRLRRPIGIPSTVLFIVVSIVMPLACPFGDGSAGAAGKQPPAAPPATDPSAPRLIENLHEYAPSAEVFPNPERGFYSFIEILKDKDLSYVRELGHRLVFSYLRLDHFRTRDMPPRLLGELDAGLAVVRRTGLKVILRVAYNEGPYPRSLPDASKAWILRHIQQLAPLLQRHADVIAVVQAGFIGAWGEWHTSTNGLLEKPADRREILEALLDALPPSRMTQVRYPQHKQEMYGGPLEAASAHGAAYAARVGHHNDCFLASDTDRGTYPPGTAERWKEFVSADGRYVVVGGETCAVFAPRTDCETALEELERLRFSFLNHDYHEEVVARWKEQKCFDTIRRRLGYRLVLEESRFSREARAGERLDVSFKVRNAGWAAPFNPRPLFLLILNDSERFEVEVPQTDVRRWLAGTTTRVAVAARLPLELRPGSYRLALWLPDAAAGLRQRPEYSVRCANRGVWDRAHGFNLLGTCDLQPATTAAVNTAGEKDGTLQFKRARPQAPSGSAN